MRVCVTTYCTWRSYGSVLQSLGLKNALKELGCDSFVLENAEGSKMRKSKLISRNLSSACDALIHKKIEKACKRGNSFIAENIDISYFSDYSELSLNVPPADVYLAGSDQIWHPALCRPEFFLDFVTGKKRVSYAASMGETKIPADREKTFAELVSNIDVVSVREKENAEIIGRYTDKPISVNIDPTFLCDADCWRKYEKEYKIKQPYILVYAIFWDKAFDSQLAALSRRTGLPVVAVAEHYKRIYADKMVYDAGPAEFLWLIDNAEYVVTSSFHGVALSTILGKQFSAVINPSSPSRIRDLTDCLGIPIVPIDELDKAECKINFSGIAKAIKAEKMKSIEYLREALIGE